MKHLLKNRAGQAVLWIIISLALFFFIMLLLFLNKKVTSPDVIENDLAGYIDSCIKSNTEELADKLISQGGFLNPENYRNYNEVKAVFLCQNIGYYNPCINQHPVYLTEIRNEIYEYIFPVANECFDSAATNYKNKGYNVTEGKINMSVILTNNLINIKINKEVILEKNKQAQRFNYFEINTKSPLYDLAKVANEISNQEAKYCYFEYLGYSILYPRFSIRRFVFSDFTEIYTITDNDSKKEMNMAIRGCAIPPGL